MSNSQSFTCPMHPEVTSDQPGSCPKCGMKLVPKEFIDHGIQESADQSYDEKGSSDTD